MLFNELASQCILGGSFYVLNAQLMKPVPLHLCYSKFLYMHASAESRCLSQQIHSHCFKSCELQLWQLCLRLISQYNMKKRERLCMLVPFSFVIYVPIAHIHLLKRLHQNPSKLARFNCFLLCFAV